MTRTGPRQAPSPTGPGLPSPEDAKRPLLLAVAVLVALLAVGATTGVLLRGSGQPSPPASSPAQKLPGTGLAQLPASDRNLMGLTDTGGQAPGFTLTDQQGRSVSLSQLEGTAIVLNFFDSRCTDVCPLVSQELLDAAQILGPRSGQVNFVAVNVNAAHSSVADVAAFSQLHGLQALPHWYYLTGSPEQLRQVWKLYGVSVEVDPQTGAVAHTSVIDFIAPGGKMRFQASPFANERADGSAWLPAGTITQWAQGIARYATQTLAGGVAGTGGA